MTLNKRVIKSQMKSDEDKCKVMCMGKDNPIFTYKIMGSELATSTWEHLQVIIDCSMQMSAQRSVAIQKANRNLEIIRKGRESKTEKIIMLLYKSVAPLC